MVNFQSTTGNGPIIKQLYFRQALAYLMNQAAVIEGPLRGYGALTVGPVGNTPVTPFLSPKGKAGDPFPYNPAKAKTLLASHGWKVVPGGVSTCANPALCGPGIKKGQGLSFSLPYATGTSWIAVGDDAAAVQRGAVGIKLNLEPKTFDQVIAVAGGNCVVAKLPCNWDMANWGGGWSFSPDYLPTGEELFLCGAIAQLRRVLRPRQRRDDRQDADQRQPAVHVHLAGLPGGPAAGDLAAGRRLPADRDRQQPARASAPQSPTLSINPENWYFVK